MFGVSSSVNHNTQILEIDTTRVIRYVQVGLKGRYPYTGIRFMDESYDIITEYSWDNGDTWTDPQEIPLGQ